MIPQPEEALHSPSTPASKKRQIPLVTDRLSWQEQLQQAITDPADLLKRLQLPEDLLPAARQAARLFPLKVPTSFVERMQPGTLDDPLLRQVMPLAEELQEYPGLSTDPLEELPAIKAPGVLHKYHGRILLTLTGACAVHCRYCFRRHFPYQDNIGSQVLDSTLDYLKTHKDIEEVIFSGGDPLSVSDRFLAHFLKEIAALPQIRRFRFHTRFPVMIPERITDSLLDTLENLPQQKVFVLHINHGNEISRAVQLATLKLLPLGTVLNQAVLLKGVNDQLDAQLQLAESLMDSRILPYYLHLPDAVSATGHFQVTEQQAKKLHDCLQARLPGYLVPRLVRENPGAPGKTLLI